MNNTNMSDKPTALENVIVNMQKTIDEQKALIANMRTKGEILLNAIDRFDGNFSYCLAYREFANIL